MHGPANAEINVLVDSIEAPNLMKKMKGYLHFVVLQYKSGLLQMLKLHLPSQAKPHETEAPRGSGFR